MMDLVDSYRNNSLIPPDCPQQQTANENIDGIDGNNAVVNARHTVKVAESCESKVNECFENGSDEISENGYDVPAKKEPSSQRESLLDTEQSTESSVDYVSSQNQERQYSVDEIHNLIDRRVSEARLEVVENKIDRVLTSLHADNRNDDQQRQLFQLLLARIKDLEDKLDKKTAISKRANQLSLDPSSELPLQRYSTYVIEKGTQTPSEDHDCEGVYVLVSKKNKQQVRQVHRHVAVVLPGENDDKPKIRESYTYPNHGHPQSTVKKVTKLVGYPEYVHEESQQEEKATWNRVVCKTIAFLPPIPDPYSKRRPRNTNNR
jgi:hypothetical protein